MAFLLAILGDGLTFFPLDSSCWQPCCHAMESHHETIWERTEPREGGW